MNSLHDMDLFAPRRLSCGILILTEGPAADVLAFTPPLALTDRELDRALDRLESAIEEVAR